MNSKTSDSTFEVIKHDHFLEIVLHGFFNYLEFSSFLKSIISTCKEHNAEVLLFDASNLSNTNLPSKLRRSLARDIVRLVGNRIKIAAVWPARDINKIIEVEVNKRNVALKVFPTRRAAINWLQH